MPTTTPTLEQLRQLAADGRHDIAPVRLDALGDFTTPVEAMRRLKAVSAHCFLLESAAAPGQCGRYSFLGYDPTLLVTCRDARMRVGEREFETRDPVAAIREVLATRRSPSLDGFPPFTGGLVGYFAYDFYQYAEPTLRFRAPPGPEGFNDLDLMLFDKVIAFDHYRQTVSLIANVRLDAPDLPAAYARAQSDLRAMLDLLRSGRPADGLSGRATSPFRREFARDEYAAVVEATKRHIREGDIFQAVPSNRLEADFEGSLFGAYRLLRTLNPSPYMFYFSGTDIEAAGASPETLVQLDRGVLRTYPIAGSRPRGATPDEDAALERSLRADPKECAEHEMLVDLGRNDLGKVCRFGTVEVERHMEVLRYSHVMHLGSSVRGELRPDRDALDAVSAVLPAGTLSGAPKLRACQIIDSLEKSRRGLYGGAVGYLDFTGNLDLCIAIRFACKAGGKVYVRSGGGIVADSQPGPEYEETVNKAAAVVRAIELAAKEELP